MLVPVMRVVAITLLLLMSSSIFADDGRAGQRQLVFEYSEDLYRDLSAMSANERMQVLVSLQGSEIADLWRAQWNLFLRAHPETNGEQRAVIDAVAEVLVELYERPRTAELESRMKDVQIRALKAFSVPVATQLFARMGSVELAPERTSPLIPKTEAIDCHCSSLSDWCDTRAFCKFGWPDSCTPYGPPGCGFLFAYACDGLCKVDHP